MPFLAQEADLERGVAIRLWPRLVSEGRELPLATTPAIRFRRVILFLLAGLVVGFSVYMRFLWW